MILVEKLLQAVVKLNASDLHMTVGLPPTLRIHGRLRPLDTAPCTPDDTVGVLKSIAPEKNQQELQEVGTTDFGFAFKDAARFRVAAFKQKGCVAIVMRQIPRKLMTFDEIGLPAIVKSLCREPRGLILVTGPTGSGKTTSLATMIDYINTMDDKHIVTIEDPIEYYHSHRKSIINQRELHVDVPSFSEALRRVLRQDPDVILVGELRDLETIEAAITAAETGHLVFGTLHTTGAEGTVNRIVDVFPVAQQEQIRTQLSVSIRSIISQQLVPTIGGEGRVAAYELLVVTPAIANLIRKNETYRINSYIQTGKKQGMILLDDHLYQLFTEGRISKEDACEKAAKPDVLAKKIDAYVSGDYETLERLEKQVSREEQQRKE
jgi:twitching motility protein PilT